jgi:hypothetical protein
MYLRHEEMALMLCTCAEEAYFLYILGSVLCALSMFYCTTSS